MSAIARRYALAAVEVAEEKGGTEGIDALAKSLERFLAAYAVSTELRETLKNPALRDVRERALESVVRKLALSSEAARLVLLLAEKNRFEILDDVVAEAEALADERVGRARAYVTTAIPLSDAQEQRLVRALEKRFARPVALSVEVDPTIVGGLVCRVGDVTMDSSVKHQLDTLRERLLA